MNNTQRIGLAIGGGVIALGAAAGVGAMAANLADTAGTTQPGGPGYGQGPGGSNRQRWDSTTMAAALASKLDVDQTAMKTALDNALQTAHPRDGGGAPPKAAPSGAAPAGGMPAGAPSGAPDGNGQPGSDSVMLTTMATSIAAELNLDQSTVLTALQEVWAQNGPAAEQPSAQPSS